MKANIPYSQVKSEARKASLFRKGDPRINRRGTTGKKAMTVAKLRLIANTGMMPVDFMIFAMRDQLYADYDVTEENNTKVFTPKPGSKKITLTVAQRLQAANGAAPYVHRRMPIAIEGGDKPLTIIDASKLAQLNVKEIDSLLSLLTKLGVSAKFDGVKGLGIPALSDSDE